MTNHSEVFRSIDDLFPGSRIKSCRTYPYRNSRISILELQGCERRKVVVKSVSHHNPKHISNEFENLSRFSNECNDRNISAPDPIYADPKKGFFIMGYVGGTNLSYFLHHLRPASIDYLNNAAELSGLALARFHSLFTSPDGRSAIDGSVREDDINRCMKESAESLSECNLRTWVRPFFDFSSWNILIGGSGSKLYLIDFPRTDYIFTPHLDLARFRFSLELIKQYPPAKILGLNLWDVDSLYDRFLKRYCEEMGQAPNENDLRLINCFCRANIRRSQDLSRKDKDSWQAWLERRYLQTFCKGWLNQ